VKKDRWRSLSYKASGPSRPEPHWPPPHGADDWWGIEDGDIGTADFTSEYLWYVRIRLQVRIADGRIVDARCLVQDADFAERDAEAAEAIVVFLRGRTVAGALTFADPIMWSPTMAIEAIAHALHDWAVKGGSARFDALPPFPKACEPYEPPLARRILRRIPFLRGLGL
jgi:hypothetical protein